VIVQRSHPQCKPPFRVGRSFTGNCSPVIPNLRLFAWLEKSVSATGSAVALNIIAMGILGVSAAAAPTVGAATSGERAATAVVASASTNGMGDNFLRPKGMGYN
jgi:hypothetical protein